MRKLFFISTVVLLCALSVKAQFPQGAAWKFTFSALPKVGNEVDLIFTAKIPAGWYMYSNDFDPGLGPVLTSFLFTPHASYMLVGEPKAINPKKKTDVTWNGVVSCFDDRAEFRQRVKILSDIPVIKGEIEYQMCSYVEGACVLFIPKFEFRSTPAKDVKPKQ